MKTMNYVLAIALLFTVGSCSKETSVQDVENEALAALEFRSRIDREEEKPQEVFELDLRQYHVLDEIGKLEQRKRNLEEEIERGNRNLLPDLEIVVKESQIYFENLNAVLESTCALLRIRQLVVERQMNDANDENFRVLFQELFDINEKLKDCGKDGQDYVADVFEGKNIMYVMSWGSKCHPGQEFKCKNLLNQGKLLINVEEELAERTQPSFKTDGGEIISNGKFIGHHEELEGIAQFELDLKNTKSGVLEIGTELEIIEVPIEVQ